MHNDGSFGRQYPTWSCACQSKSRRLAALLVFSTAMARCSSAAGSLHGCKSAALPTSDGSVLLCCRLTDFSRRMGLLLSHGNDVDAL